MAAYRGPLLLEVFCQSFDQVDGAVLAACAANADSHVAAMVQSQQGQPTLQKLLNVLLHLLHLRHVAQVVGYGLIQTCQRSQIAFIVRVGQHAHIEHIVRVCGHAVLEAKGLEHQRHLPFRRINGLLDIALQLGRFQVAGVDDDRLVAQRTKQIALFFNVLLQCLTFIGCRAGGEWMASAGF